MTRRLAFIVLLAACSDSGAPADATTARPDVDVAACGSIGMACTTTCPAGLECISTNVCASVRGDCGGFSGAMCQDTSLTCTYPTGSSAGHCMRDDEKACLCAIAPNALGDCMQP
ncbi:MAG TPA: hypothetical protein VFV99_23875 [Kofleriaceae bacterium]|nr:hypothetical protein [Kofleriaceae bacterium]